jgi:hypothetical protein
VIALIERRFADLNGLNYFGGKPGQPSIHQEVRQKPDPIIDIGHRSYPWLRF